MINIESILKQTFPDKKFLIKNSINVTSSIEEKIDIYVEDIDFYLSDLFASFLDNIAKDLTDEEYMNLDFYPGFE